MHKAYIRSPSPPSRSMYWHILSHSVPYRLIRLKRKPHRRVRPSIQLCLLSPQHLLACMYEEAVYLCDDGG